MHEGDHSILDHDHEYEDGARHRTPPGRASRLAAAIIVGAGVVLFLLWRFL